MIDVDDVQSFTNKMRELNLPLFKVYFSQQNVAKNAPDPKGMNKGEQRRDEYLDAGNKMMADNDDDDKRTYLLIRYRSTEIAQRKAYPTQLKVKTRQRTQPHQGIVRNQKTQTLKNPIRLAATLLPKHQERQKTEENRPHINLDQPLLFKQTRL